MKKNKNKNPLKKVGTALGVGLLAGLAGTIAMTIAQRIEMKMTGRKPSDVPVKALRELMDVKPVTESKSISVSNKIHFLYGIDIGMIRGLISLSGLRGLEAISVHFATIWCAELIVLPVLKVSPPVYKQEPKAVFKDALFHWIYAATTGLVFDWIYDGCSNCNKKEPEDKFSGYRRNTAE
ncbi:MAG: hypothetical protein ABIW47_04275 [Ginsengibacter sp.]|jgi:hypothetical protein